MPDAPPAIPPALLAILRTAWDADVKYQAWDVAWDRGDRARDPSFYILRPGAETDWPGPISRAEADALVTCGLLAGLAHRDGATLSVNEHAAHALRDFAAETYAAWHKLRDRLALARSADQSARRR
jgi:hypothetical protein